MRWSDNEPLRMDKRRITERCHLENWNEICSSRLERDLNRTLYLDGDDSDDDDDDDDDDDGDDDDDDAINNNNDIISRPSDFI